MIREKWTRPWLADGNEVYFKSGEMLVSVPYGRFKGACVIASRIAATLELYEAVEALLALDELEFGDESLLPPDHPVILARAALTKARGESHE